MAPPLGSGLSRGGGMEGSQSARICRARRFDVIGPSLRVAHTIFPASHRQHPSKPWQARQAPDQPSSPKNRLESHQFSNENLEEKVLSPAQTYAIIAWSWDARSPSVPSLGQVLALLHSGPAQSTPAAPYLHLSPRKTVCHVWILADLTVLLEVTPFPSSSSPKLSTRIQYYRPTVTIVSLLRGPSDIAHRSTVSALPLSAQPPIMSAEPNSKFAPEPQITHKGRELSFKQKLDQAAHDARKSEEEPKQNPIVEKAVPITSTISKHNPHHPAQPSSVLATSYIPAAAKILGNPQEEKEEKISRPGIPGPPERPYDDVQVEEFIRQQHRSKGEDGILQ
ncbi:uncharacterized protein CLUP02_08012 [Colletotrichum lupini]|uniref:Uncharacterized protein n=1 Tax=Colletotrichum lupini TaxID=145971 RepID=A0A9Q8WGI3_9PEZI|nr:uncharacterized protein CLUP02_08012 [Colletotrichum lupini]UQC82524.1 hypothetical protein CLUP02_08012 [Colletotrichum lupini]